MEVVYDAIGVSVGQTEDGQELVGLMLPKDQPLNEDDFDELFMTLPAAKTLLIDLRDAIDVAMKHKSDGN